VRKMRPGNAKNQNVGKGERRERDYKGGKLWADSPGGMAYPRKSQGWEKKQATAGESAYRFFGGEGENNNILNSVFLVGVTASSREMEANEGFGKNKKVRNDCCGPTIEEKRRNVGGGEKGRRTKTDKGEQSQKGGGVRLCKNGNAWERVAETRGGGTLAHRRPGGKRVKMTW